MKGVSPCVRVSRFQTAEALRLIWKCYQISYNTVTSLQCVKIQPHSQWLWLNLLARSRATVAISDQGGEAHSWQALEAALPTGRPACIAGS